MLTIFACPKPFTDPHIAIIQRNAITSWTLLRPRPEIILFADEPGTAEICQELGLQHIPAVARSNYGKPLLSDIFTQAQRVATADTLAYVNSDIILTSALLHAIRIVQAKWRDAVIICTPWNLRLHHQIKFTEATWETDLRDLVDKKASPPRPIGVDIVVFPKGFYREVPPFALGGTGWDNWLIYYARRRGAPLVDATPFVVAIHQDHEHSTHSGTYVPTNESILNYQLAGHWAASFVAADAPYLLEASGRIRRRALLDLLRPRVQAIWGSPAVRRLLVKTYRLRRAIGLQRRRTGRGGRDRPVSGEEGRQGWL